mgnify:CR=1 FL=1
MLPIAALIPEGARVVVCFDCDALDPAVMPAVIARTPGGLGYWDVIELIAGVAAKGRIAGLAVTEFMAARDIDGQGAAVAAAIVTTALMHHLVSKYTSLVAVDKTPARPAGNLLAREQVPNLVASGQSARAIFGFPATATNAAELRQRGLLIVLATLLILAMSAWYRRVTHGTQR